MILVYVDFVLFARRELVTNRLPSEVPPAVATFINLCDEIIDAKLPMGRLGTSLVKGKLTLYLGDS